MSSSSRSISAMTNDIIAACAEVTADGPILILAHPASGTKWLQSQLATALDGRVAHEALHGWHIKDHKAVITFKHWHPGVLRQYAHIFALTRDPLKVIPSATPLFELPHLKGTILAMLFGDGLARGVNWANLQNLPEATMAYTTLIRWYELAEGLGSTIEKWFRIEDAVSVVDARANTKNVKKVVLTYDYIFEKIDPVAATKLAQLADRHGYDVPMFKPGGKN